jgi:hypothetical protein
VNRTVRILAAFVALFSLVGADAAQAATPRVQVASPWSKDDTVGEAFRPAGDVRRVVIQNGRQNVTFTFQMRATPIWSTVPTSRHTFMAFRLDWQNTSAAHNRRVTVSKADGGWHIVVYNGTGGAVCVQDGGVQLLSDHRYRISVPTGGTYHCLGGQHVLRVASTFTDDQDDSADEDLKLDRVPNNGGYGPFIRLP